MSEYINTANWSTVFNIWKHVLGTWTVSGKTHIAKPEMIWSRFKVPVVQNISLSSYYNGDVRKFTLHSSIKGLHTCPVIYSFFLIHFLKEEKKASNLPESHMLFKQKSGKEVLSGPFKLLSVIWKRRLCDRKFKIRHKKLMLSQTLSTGVCFRKSAPAILKSRESMRKERLKKGNGGMQCQLLNANSLFWCMVPRKCLQLYRSLWTLW